MIYQIKEQVRVLNEVGFSTEKDLQRFCETNLELLLGLTFVASEFKVASFRFDSVAYAPASKAFIVIEYKNDRNFSVIDQGYSYISTLLNHKADFVLKYNQVFHESKGLEDFDWTQVRVLFIAPHYTTYQMSSINFRDLPMELWRIKRYEENILQFEQIMPTNTTASISGYVSSGLPGDTLSLHPIDVPSHEVVVYTEDDRLADGSDKTREYYAELRDYILALDDSIVLKATKLYVGFLFKNHNLVDIKLQKNSIILWLNTQYGVLEDPQGIICDVTHIGHHGNGDCQIKWDEPGTYMGYIKDLIQTHSPNCLTKKEGKVPASPSLS